MTTPSLTSKDYAKALGIGIAVAVIVSMVMVPLFKAGVSPMPKPLSLAFAQRLLGPVPLPVGLLFHVAYVTFWSVAYIALFHRRTFMNAVWLALALWILVLVFFFPFVGWGFLGLGAGMGPKLLLAALLPHSLFAVLLWGFCRWLLPPRPAGG